MRSERALAATVGLAMLPVFGAALLARIHLREVGHVTRWRPGVANAQLAYLAIGCLVGAALAIAGPTRLAKVGGWISALGVGVLLLAARAAHVRFEGLVLTPAELAKPVFVIGLASALAAEGARRALGVGAATSMLLLVDGTSAVVLLTVGLGAAWIAQPRGIRHVGAIAVGVGVAGALVGAALLRPYQWARLRVWVDGGDPRSSGWLAAQVRAALAEAGLYGTGRYPKFADHFEHNDLALVDLAARFGFVAIVVVLAVHVSVVLYCLHAAARASDRCGAAVAAGTAGLFAWHGLGNAAMVAGLLPLANLRFALVSYGGSSVVAFSRCSARRRGSPSARGMGMKLELCVCGCCN